MTWRTRYGASANASIAASLIERAPSDPPNTSKQRSSAASANRARAAAGSVAGGASEVSPSRREGARLTDEAAKLTLRELEVLPLLAAGKSNAEIADALFIGRGTVRNHVSGILAKLGAKTRTEAADLARRQGLL